MKPLPRHFFWNALSFIAVFSLLALPGFFAVSRGVTQAVEIQASQPSRKMASVSSSSIKPAQKRCEVAQKWRYHCPSGKDSCRKQKKEVYLKCEGLF